MRNNCALKGRSSRKIGGISSFIDCVGGNNEVMNEELVQAKEALQKVNIMSDIKSNPLVQTVLMSNIKQLPIIGDMIDSTMDRVIEEFQKKKEQELLNVILKDKNSITSEMDICQVNILKIASSKSIWIY